MYMYRHRAHGAGSQGRDQPCPTSTSCVFYHLDDDTSKHVLQLENYTKEWVLLQATV